MHRLLMRAGLALLALAVAVVAPRAPLGAQGAMRNLSCRGNTGMVLRVHQDPSPRDTANVTMVLEYRRSTLKVGTDMRKLEPGTCTWNPTGWPTFPVEPGYVRFDVRRHGQRWSATERRMMDTTVRSAIWFPDPITLPRYLLDSARYWRFYVNDATNFSTSYGALFESGTPNYVWVTGPVQFANDVRRDLLCRGGTSGLLFGGGASIGNNQAKVQLSYRVSPNVPGGAGAGLAPGSCAWTNRTAMPPEPGKIWFITASNAQLKQMQSGVPIDRSPTAAERYPDMRSIPEYLKDPARYWRFTVVSRATDTALAHGVWKPDYGSVVAGGLRDPGTSPERSQPSNLPSGGVFRPGGAGSVGSVQSLYDIRNVVISPMLENLVIGFQAAPNIAPVVTVTPASGGAPVTIPVQGSSQGAMWRYVGSSKTPLKRSTRYKYTIDAPASANARANAASGTFKTLGQRVTVAFTEIYLVSDGDGDSNGELTFEAETCPRYLLEHWQLGRTILAPLDWGNGRHVIDQKMTSYGDTVPDRFRVLVFGLEDDRAKGSQGVERYPIWTSYCTGSGPEPGSNGDWEWNSLVLDFDLTKYPGAKGGEQFYKRAKALRNGSSLAFEVRGYIQVTRQ